MVEVLGRGKLTAAGNERGNRKGQGGRRSPLPKDASKELPPSLRVPHGNLGNLNLGELQHESQWAGEIPYPDRGRRPPLSAWMLGFSWSLPFKRVLFLRESQTEAC